MTVNIILYIYLDYLDIYVCSRIHCYISATVCFKPLLEKPVEHNWGGIEYKNLYLHYIIKYRKMYNILLQTIKCILKNKMQTECIVK